MNPRAFVFVAQNPRPRYKVTVCCYLPSTLFLCLTLNLAILTWCTDRIRVLSLPFRSFIMKMSACDSSGKERYCQGEELVSKKYPDYCRTITFTGESSYAFFNHASIRPFVDPSIHSFIRSLIILPIFSHVYYIMMSVCFGWKSYICVK